MAAQVAANAQKMGIDVVYFDSESAIDPAFLKRAGCDLDTLLYVQAQSVEFVLETIEDLLGSNENRMLFQDFEEPLEENGICSMLETLISSPEVKIEELKIEN